MGIQDGRGGLGAHVGLDLHGATHRWARVRVGETAEDGLSCRRVAVGERVSVNDELWVDGGWGGR